MLTKGLKMCYYIVTTKGDDKECDSWQSIILKSVLIKKKLNKISVDKGIKDVLLYSYNERR